MSNGTVIQIIGAVIDVEFPKQDLPKIYDALKVDETGLVLEVQQQLGAVSYTHLTLPTICSV